MVVKYPPIGAIFKKKGSLPITPRVAFLLSSQFHYSHMHNSQRSSRHPCLSHVKKKKDLEMDSRMFHKTVSDSQANNGNTITRLGTESLKGLGTKACTNWEDRSANSLAYQVSNHSTFFFYMLDVSVCWALIWWEPFCTTSKDTVLPQNLWLMCPALILFVRTCMARCASPGKHRCSCS